MIVRGLSFSLLFVAGFAFTLFANATADTLPFLVMPDGRKVMASHFWQFPLKRESSGLAYDSLSQRFFTCFDKGIPQLASFRLADSISDLRELSIAGDTTYYDLEGISLQHTDSSGVRLKLCGERVLKDSLPILTLRCTADSCWHDSELALVRPFTPGVNTNSEGIAVFSNVTVLAKEREPAKLVYRQGRIKPLPKIIENGLPFTADSTTAGHYFRSHPAFQGVNDHRVQAARRLAFSDIYFDLGSQILLAINRPARTILCYSFRGGEFLHADQCRYELIDHPAEWTDSDTGDLLYGLVEGMTIAPVDGVRSLVLITDPGIGNYPKVTVFPWELSLPH